MRQALQIMPGERFGKLEVIRRLENKNRKQVLECRCDCGKSVSAYASHLKCGQRKSCGCAIKKPGRDDRRTYTSYHSMLQRCLNENSTGWKDYGGRGVKVCERWLESYDNFLKDMGHRPPNTTLDKDILGNGFLYSPETCMWATTAEQAYARRGVTSDDFKQVCIRYRKDGMTAKQIAKIMSVPDYTVRRNWK